MFTLDGSIAVVTGGAGLFGKPISWALAEAGATVIIASRDTASCSSLAAQMKEQGLSAEGAHLDLGEDTSIAELTRSVTERHGRIDILVNNAVSRHGMKDLEQLSRSDLEESQRINSNGTLLITRSVVEVMRRQGRGNIINIGSIQGAVGPRFPVYGSTGMSSPVNYTYDKWGMVGFTKWLANYYGRYNIRANCISPGGYNPALYEDSSRQEFVENYKRLTPLGRFANENDIKGPVVFLASEASSYVTGHNLMVDGGWTSW